MILTKRAWSSVFAGTLVFALCPTPARAQSAPLPEGPRIGVQFGAGGGFAVLTGAPSYYPSVVGITLTQIELTAETPRVGGFLRGTFYSSGTDGRWTAPAITLGGSYRFFGDGETTWSLLARGGLAYERWHATNTAAGGGCFVPLFFPDNCKLPRPQPIPGTVLDEPATYTTTVDAFGLLVGARLEMPFRPVLISLGAELVSVVDLSSSSPGTVLHAQATLTFALRSHHGADDTTPGGAAPARHKERGL